MKLLLDTNILIPAEPTEAKYIEPATPGVVALVRLSGAGRHTLYVHPASKVELRRDSNPARRNARLILLEKYEELPAPPHPSQDLLRIVGSPTPGSHDEVDIALLTAVHADAVDLLVTDDAGLHKKASRANLSRRVLTADDAEKVLRAYLPREIKPPPTVRKLLAHELDARDPIFDSLRDDYPGFDEWLSKCKKEHRPAWVVVSGHAYDAVSIAKQEAAGEHGLRGRLLKICTFKASFGRGLGELLLRAVLEYAMSLAVDQIYVEVLPKHGGVITLLQQFGFTDLGSQTKRGEKVLAKRESFSREEYDAMNPLEFNVRHGPFRLKVHGTQAFVVPIRPRYHAILFPELEDELFPRPTPSGNAIRKAYLCHTKMRELPPGSPLLFYRSRDRRQVACVGVAEATLRSSDVDDIERFVTMRTVYTHQEIMEFCGKEVLAILFRHAKVLDRPWTAGELMGHRVLKGWPQSILRVPQEGMKWLEEELSPLH